MSLKTKNKTDKQAFIIMENPYSSGWRPHAVCLNEEDAKLFIVGNETKYLKYKYEPIKIEEKNKGSWLRNLLLFFRFNKNPDKR